MGQEGRTVRQAITPLGTGKSPFCFLGSALRSDLLSFSSDALARWWLKLKYFEVSAGGYFSELHLTSDKQ